MKWIKCWTATVASPTHPERNEDHLWVAKSGYAAAVIDGMGGYRRKGAEGEVGGEHASTLAAQVLAEMLDDWDGSLPLKESKAPLRGVIEAVNQRLWEELNWGGKVPPEENPEGKQAEEMSVGVAMTLIALCDGGSRALAAQHGDTHGYALKEEMGLIQITEDQDLLTWERINGLISEEEAVRITQAIDHFDGINLTDMMDQKVMRYFFDKNIFGALGVDGICPETGWSAIRLAPGDRLALLSDGAYSNLSIDELLNLLAYPDDPAQVVVELAQQRAALPRFPDVNDLNRPYNMRATQDDMTVVVVELGVGEEDAESEAESAPPTPADRPKFVTEPLAPPTEPLLVPSDVVEEGPPTDLWPPQEGAAEAEELAERDEHDEGQE